MELKRSIQSCSMCPRMCRIDRSAGEKGYCGAPAEMIVARAALHHWEEPSISGTRGSGTVFFSYCSLRCSFCQNFEISHGGKGISVTAQRLANILVRLQSEGAHNINFVTGDHYSYAIPEVVSIARSEGLSIPIVWNTGSYENIETIESISRAVDVYLPDMKFISPKVANKYTGTPDYPEHARKAIEYMYSIAGETILGTDGTIKKGMMIRHLVLPGYAKEAMAILDWIRSTFGKDMHISLMSQFTPMSGDDDWSLNRRLHKREYKRVVDHLFDLGFENGYIQELSSAQKDYVPRFDGTGI